MPSQDACTYLCTRGGGALERSRPRSATQKEMIRGGRKRPSPVRETMSGSTIEDTRRGASGGKTEGGEAGIAAAVKQHSLQTLHLPEAPCDSCEPGCPDES
jgi:hypothetical protein